MKKDFLSEITRRRFLKLLSASAASTVNRTPAMTILGALLDGVVNNAVAQGRKRSRNYVYVTGPGAPPRWLFDAPVKLHKDDPFVPHPLVATAKRGGSYVYETIEYGRDPISNKSYNLPALWGLDIPVIRSSGLEWIPMTQLADKMLILRGVHMPVDGHGACRTLQIRPDSSKASLTGIVADSSDRQMAAVEMSHVNRNRFFSELNKSPFIFTDPGLKYDFNIPEDNPLAQLLEPFNQKNNLFQNRRLTEEATKQALEELGRYTKSRMPGAEYLYNNYSEAEKLLKKGISLIGGRYWTAAKDRYTRVQNAVLQKNDWNATLGFDSIPANPTMSQQQNKDKNFLSSLVISEFLLNEKLSSSLLLQSGETSLFLGNDIHGAPESPIGVREHTEPFSLQYRVHAALIHQLSQSLSSDVWKDTMIQFGAEFGRNPRDDLTGSDHGTTGSSLSVFGGAIQGPVVIGNTVSGQSLGHADSSYNGSWGQGDSVSIPVLGEGPMSIFTQISSLAELLGVESMLSNFPSLLTMDSSGQIRSLIGPPTQRRS